MEQFYRTLNYGRASRGTLNHVRTRKGILDCCSTLQGTPQVVAELAKTPELLLEDFVGLLGFFLGVWANPEPPDFGFRVFKDSALYWALAKEFFSSGYHKLEAGLGFIRGLRLSIINKQINTCVCIYIYIYM